MLLDEHGPRCKSAMGCASGTPKLGLITVITFVVTHDDVDDATNCVCSVERSSLRAANHLDALDRVGAQLGEQKRIRDLDAIYVDLGIAHLKRARTTQTAVPREEGGG